MRNYLAAECYKVFHRKYFYLTLLVVLALEGVLLWGYHLTLNWGNPNVDFNFAAGRRDSVAHGWLVGQMGRAHV